MKRTRQVNRQASRTKLTERVTIVSLAVLITGISFFVSLNLNSSEQAYGSVSGDYRSKASGNWNSTATWEKYNGASWVPAVATPTSADGVIEILSGHTVTVTASVTADQVLVDAGGSVIINSASALTIANGAGTDLDVNGTIRVNDNGKVVKSGAPAIAFNANSIFEVNWTSTTLTAGVIPAATWDATSTVKFIGFTTVTGNSDFGQLQHFGNVIYNCPNQSVICNLYYTFMSNDVVGDISLQGDFTLISTGTGSILTGNVTPSNQVIAGNFNMQGGTLICTNTGSRTLNVNGNFSMTGGALRFADNGGGNYTMNVTGDFSISGGTLDMNQYTGVTAGNGIGTLNLNGNFSQTGGTITETATSVGYGSINFKKSGYQVFSKTVGTCSNTVNFNVNGSSILDMGTSIAGGSGSFTLSSGGGLIMGSLAGITSSGATGNVQVTGARSFSTTANYTYEGVSSQVSGNGLPATVNNLIQNNGNDLTLTNTVSVAGILNIASGIIITGANELKMINTSTTSITGQSSSNYVIGNLRRYVNASGSYNFPIGTPANYELLSITLTGITGFTNILGTFTNANPIEAGYPLTGLSILGTPVIDMLDYGYWTLTPNASLTGGTYNVTLNEKGQTNPGALAASHCVLKRTGLGSSWQSLGTHNNNTQSINGGVVTATRTIYNSFSDFGIGKAGGVFPVELIYFNADLKDDQVDLSWATATELNNDHFTVERSPDETHFDELLRKPGAGNSSNTLYYSAVDENPLHGNSYYRLKQTDYDGHSSYSEIKTIKYKSKGYDGLSITSIIPNPFNEKFTVSFMVKTASTVTFQLTNSSSQTVFKDIIYATDGMNQYDFTDQAGLPQGIYFMTLLYNDKKLTQKIIKN